MKRRRLVILLSVPVVVLGLGLLLAGWVLNSDSGARWLLSRVTNNLEGRLSLGKVTGNFSNGLVITDFRFDQEGMEIIISQLETVVGFSLLPLQVNVRTLHGEDFKIGLGRAESTSKDSSETVRDSLAGLNLPIAITLDDVVMTGLEVLDIDQQTLLQLDRISLSGHWKDVIELRQLAVEAPSLVAGMQGRVVLSPPFALQWSGDVKIVDAEAMANFEFALKGVPDDYELELQAIFDTTGLPDYPAPSGRG